MFGDILQELRKDKKLKQKELAKQFNLSAAVLSNYEIGKSEPDYDTLIRFADYFDVPVDYLIGRVRCRYSWAELCKPVELTGQSVPAAELLNDILELSVTDRDKLVDYLGLLKSAGNKREDG